jgi:hypothetical protein
MRCELCAERLQALGFRLQEEMLCALCCALCAAWWLQATGFRLQEVFACSLHPAAYSL